MGVDSFGPSCADLISQDHSQATDPEYGYVQLDPARLVYLHYRPRKLDDLQFHGRPLFL
jgi:hypothetical protein